MCAQNAQADSKAISRVSVAGSAVVRAAERNGASGLARRRTVPEPGKIPGSPETVRQMSFGRKIYPRTGDRGAPVRCGNSELFSHSGTANGIALDRYCMARLQRSSAITLKHHSNV